ncbi:MAG: glycosyltransferase [Candidatus Yanofskybacteria bacterium]|nr:glycosyltransferase [Candidatus Yanofskybacteria bacterium]
MKIAFVHDYLNQYGGAERVLKALCDLYPRAPIYTTLYDSQTTRGVFDRRVIRTSFLQNLPFGKKYHHAFSPLMPMAVEQFDFSNFDVVLSISHSFAKGIITKPGTRHVCYCLTPPRYLWDDSHKYVQEFQYSSIVKKFIPPFLSYLRVWDREASLRPDELVSISQFVKGRINKYYNRSSEIIYPPVDAQKFKVAEWVDDYFLMVGRLVTYKKFDMVINVFNNLGWPLKIVGTGIELQRLKKIAGPTIEFLGQVEDEKLPDLYARARALIFPQEEDFGIVPLEAMASGRPVIAFAGGGALETVVDGKTGVFFHEQNEESLELTLKNFDHRQFDPELCRTQAEKFDLPVFQDQMRHLLE